MNKTELKKIINKTSSNDPYVYGNWLTNGNMLCSVALLPFQTAVEIQAATGKVVKENPENLQHTIDRIVNDEYTTQIEKTNILIDLGGNVFGRLFKNDFYSEKYPHGAWIVIDEVYTKIFNVETAFIKDQESPLMCNDGNVFIMPMCMENEDLNILKI